MTGYSAIFNLITLFIAIFLIVQLYRTSSVTKFKTIERLNEALKNGEVNEEHYFIAKSKIIAKQNKK